MNRSLPAFDLDNQLKRTIRITCGVIVFLFLGLLWNPSDPLLLGMTIGVSVGLFNSFTLAQRIHRMAAMGPDGAKRYMSMGQVMRIALVVAVVFFCGKTGAVNIIGLGAGIVSVSVISALDNAVTALLGSGEGNLSLPNK